MSEQTYRIKALEWAKSRDDDCLEVWLADVPFIRLEVYHQKRGGFFRWGFATWDKPCASLEDGKAKAEAYFRERLITALDPA